MRAQALFFTLLATSLVLTFGCTSKKILDEKVDELVEAFQEDDYEAFKKISSSSLTAEVNEERFHYLASVIKELGDYNERTMSSVNRTNDRREGQYTLDFDAGEVHLEIVLEDEELIGFDFTGEPVKEAQAAVAESQYKDFKVSGFTFMLEDKKTPNPSGSLYKQLGVVNYSFQVQGLMEKGGNIHPRVGVVLFNAAGEEIGRNDNYLDTDIPKAEVGPVLTVYGDVVVEKAATYTLKFKVTDSFEEKSQPIVFEEALVVRPEVE